MNKWIVVVAAGLASLVCASALAQRPLYDAASGTSLFTDRKAFIVGDVITIVIREKASAASASNTETDYNSKVSGGPGTGTLGFVNLWGLDHAGSYSGDGSTKRSGSLVAEMSARILEVLPNDQFRIEGKRTVRINGEFETIAVSGTIRARDVSPDNRVLSTNIADAAITYEGKGDVGHAGSPGLFTKIVNWLF